MAILETEAVVLRGWKLGETSKILALFTRKYGPLRVVAKGARQPKSAFKGCLEPLTRIRIVFYEKRTRELQLLSKADLIEPHLHIIGDVKRTALGLASAELIFRAVVGEEPFPDLFDLFVNLLRGLDECDGCLECLLWYFQVHFIDLMGYKPTWDRCLKCGNALGGGGETFQPQSGGLLCRRCGSGSGGLIVGSETLEILYWLQGAAYEQVGRLVPSRSQKAEIRKMFDLYFRTHIEHMSSLRSLGIFYEFEEQDREVESRQRIRLEKDGRAVPPEG